MKISECLNAYLLVASFFSSFWNKYMGEFKVIKLKKNCYDAFNFLMLKPKTLSYSFYNHRDDHLAPTGLYN